MDIKDIPITIDVVIGSTVMQLKDVETLMLNEVIELNKIAGSNVDIRVNGKKIAEGEIVIVNEKFGVRILDVV